MNAADRLRLSRGRAIDRADAAERALRELIEQFDAYRGGWLGPDAWRDRIGLPDALASARAALNPPNRFQKRD